MKSLSIIYVLISFICLNISAQTFSKYIQLLGTTDSGWSVIPEDDGYMILNSVTFYTDTGFYFADRLVKTNLEGDVKWTKLIDSIPKNTNISGLNSITRTKDSNYILSGTRTKESLLDQALILNLNSQGDTLWSYVFGKPNDLKEVPILTHELPSGNTLTLGWKEIPNEHSDMFLTKFTPDGNFLWEKTIPVDCEFHWAGRMVLTEDEHFLIPYSCYDGFITFPNVMKIDSMGNVLWDKNYDVLTTEFGCVTNIANVNILPNGGYAFSWCKPDLIGFIRDTTHIFGVNANHEIEWSIPLLDNVVNNKIYIYANRRTPNGDIIFGGFNGATFEYKSAGFFAKVSPQGELLWQRFIILADRPWDLPRLNNFELLPDGGIIATGDVVDTVPSPKSDVWLLKLDEDGCFTPGCTEENIYISKAVPTDEIVNDLKEVFFQLSPNPTTHLAHLNFYNPIQRENVLLKVYSMNGQLMYRQVLSKGVQDIDLEVVDYPSGLYLVSLEWEGRILQKEKLVKQ